MHGPGITSERLIALISELDNTDILFPDPESANLINILNENMECIGQIDIEREEIVWYVPVRQQKEPLEITMRCRGMEE